MIKEIYRAQFRNKVGEKANVGGDIGTLEFTWKSGPYLVLDDPGNGSPTRNIFPGEDVEIGGKRYLYVEGENAGSNGTGGNKNRLLFAMLF